MGQTVLFTPGAGERIDDFRPYQDTLDVIKGLGYTTHFVEIEWGEPENGSCALADDVKDTLRSVYDSYDDPAKVILAGFSFGALASLRVAAERPPAATWCFSLAPFFKEDMTPEFLGNLKGTYGPGELESYQRISFAALARQVACPVELFIGQQEGSVALDRSTAALQALSATGVHLTIAPDTGHDVTNPHYLKAIQTRLQATRNTEVAGHGKAPDLS